MLTRHLKLALFLSAAWLAQATAFAGEVKLFSREGLQGRQLSLRDDTRNLTQAGFNDRAESMVIYSGRWEICEHADFGGRCRVFEPGEYHSLSRLGNTVSSLREVDGRDGGGGWRGDDRDDRRDDRMEMAGPIVLFNAPGMRGRSIGVRDEVRNLNEQKFNDKTQSILVQRGQWEVCQHVDFGGRCRVFGPGQYASLDRDFTRSISSVRRVGGGGRGDGDGRRDGVELFNGAGFGGDRMPVRDELRNLQVVNFNDRAGSLIVYSGSWEFCEHADFAGQCFTYGPGRYDRLGRLHNQISSIRRVR